MLLQLVVGEYTCVMFIILYAACVRVNWECQQILVLDMNVYMYVQIKQCTSNKPIFDIISLLCQCTVISRIPTKTA